MGYTFKKNIGKKKSSIQESVNISNFIKAFNDADKLSMNTGLDKIPLLTDNEFIFAQSEAIKAGYELSKHEDNYNTITYKLSYL